MNPTDLIDELDELSDPRRHCFLCGADLSVCGGTVEHVIPVWAQKRYDLWNQRLTLVNGTDIPYSQMTIPCCNACNSRHLSSVEDSIAATVESGRSAVMALGPKTIFLWLGKIFYGILYKELMLLRNRADPGSGTMITEDFLKEYGVHRMFLQQARGAMTLVDFEPGSLFVFEAQRMKNDRLSWDLTDSVDGMVIGIRVGRVAMIGALADGGAQTLEDGHIYEDYESLPIHPLQFRELVACVAYRSSLATRVPKYVTAATGTGMTTWQMPLGGFSLKPLFEPWVASDYAKFCAYYTGLKLEEVFIPPDKARTWMEDDHGNPLYLDYATHEWQPR